MPTRGRVTYAGNVVFTTLSASSVLQFGDTADSALLRSRVLALQREKPNFSGDELSFAAFPLFHLPHLVPSRKPPVAFFSDSAKGPLRIGTFHAIGLSNSCLARFGNGGGPHVAESRIVDIRHFSEHAPVGRDVR